MNKLEELFSKFLQYLKLNNFSVKTIESYKNSLKFYLKFIICQKIKETEYFTIQTAVGFNKYLLAYKKADGKKLTPKSIAGYYNKTSRFHIFLLKNSYILFNPYELLEPIKSKKDILKKSIPVEDVEKILAQPRLNTLSGIRDRTMLEVLYSTGIRKEELRSLQIYDVDLNAGFIKVKGKGKKDRIVPIGENACKFLDKYINTARIWLMNDASEDHLFLSKRGRQLSEGSVGLIIQTHIKSANLKKHYSCHSFRHTCAVEMLKGKANIKHIQEMLGHSSLSTTQIYTQMLPLDLKKIHLETHPSNWILNSIK